MISPRDRNRAAKIAEARCREMIESGAWPQTVLNTLFDRNVSRHHDKPAIVAHEAETGRVTRLSYGELDLLSRRVAAGLRALGVERGDVVAFQLPNHAEFHVLTLACGLVGAVANPLMPILRQRELRFMLGLAQAKVFVVPTQFRNHAYLAMALELQAELPTLRHVSAIGGQGAVSFEERLLGHPPLQGPAALEPDEVSLLLYTSGTTGEPKGVMHTSNTLYSHMLPFIERLRLGEHDVFMCPTPLAHGLGYLYGLLAPFTLGGTAVLQDLWAPQVAADLIRSERAAIVMGATPFLADLAGLPPAAQDDFISLRYFVSGGAPIPPALATRARERMSCEIIPVWGMTECLAPTTLLAGEPPERASESDGTPLPHTAVKVVDDSGRELARGEQGRLMVRGASLCVGYLERPALYMVDEQGWLDTGDLARMHANGYIRITGRTKDMIIRGGENVPVVEIEGLLYQHPDVAQVAIVGTPDERLGELGCVFVVAKAGTAPTLESLTAFLRERQVSRTFWPERLELLDAMPMTASGKIQKFVLREWAGARVVKRA
ncbi:MAG: AMP-binding protein [Panacagrimonas sp.]